MQVENSAKGWAEFADAMLARSAPGSALEAEVHISGALDPDQLASLRCALMEFDRMELLWQRQSEKLLKIFVNSMADAYRIYHFFWIMIKTRAKFTLSVYMGGVWIAAPRFIEDGSAAYRNDDGVDEAGAENLALPLRRIFPLLCVGKADENDSVVDYNNFIVSRKPSEVEKRLRALFERGENIFARTALEYVEFFYQYVLQSALDNLSGTKGASLTEASKRALQKDLQDFLLEQMPALGLLTRMLWALSLWALADTKDLLKWDHNENGWTLDQEALQCSRLDAISYAEGLQQLTENAYLHSDVYRAYLSIRMHHTAIENQSVSILKKTVPARDALGRRIRRLTWSAEEPATRVAYELENHVKYYFEFQVVNDSIMLQREPGRPVIAHDSRGMVETYLINTGRTFPPAKPFGLRRLFAGEREQPVRKDQQPRYLAQHYGLRIFEKVVRLNSGYFYVSSPGAPTNPPFRWRDRRDQVLNRYHSFGTDMNAPGVDLPDGRFERYTSYSILLPITAHWRNAENKDEPSRSEELFTFSALETDYRQIILRLQQDDGRSQGNDRYIFTEEAFIQAPSAKDIPSLSYHLSVEPEKKMGVVDALCENLTAQLIAMEAGSETVCLLDLMQGRDLVLIELIAKMLFLFIAQNSGAEDETDSLRPYLFALLLPAKEYVWEFVRIFSIFYDKLQGNQAMERSQIALCCYPQGPAQTLTPEIAFLLAGNSSASAWITARNFSYYNTGLTMEMIPQLHYLTRGASVMENAARQFPFDLVLTARVESNAVQEGNSWFLQQMDNLLLGDLWKRPLGCRIHGVKVRLKSSIFLRDFYEAELLFHNIGIVYRFAYLIARDILRQLHTPGCLEKVGEVLILTGYENYSAVLVAQIAKLLNECAARFGPKPVHYLICSSQTEGDHAIHPSPLLQNMEPSHRKALLQKASYVSVVPIGTTLSTMYRIHNEVEAYAGVRNFPLENYVLILVGEEPGGTKSAPYWETSERGGSRQRLVRLKPERSHAQQQTSARFFLKPLTVWTPSVGADVSLQEDVLAYVDQTSTIPRDIFIGENSRFRGILSFFRKDGRVSSSLIAENDRRIELLRSCVYYGHLVSSNNHFQFYFDMDRYFGKIMEPIQTGSSNPRRKNLSAWLQELRAYIDANAYNIIVSPLHQEDSPFAKAVVDQVFEHSLRFLHIDISDVFREDVRSRFSYVAEEYAKIKRFDEGKAVNVYFVNTAITSGITLQRARNLTMMLLEESGLHYDRGNVFKGCFVLINRSGFDTINAYLDEPLANFHAYVHLAVPSMNLHKNRCPTCELVERYQTIEQRCSSGPLRREFHRLAEKHAARSLREHRQRQDLMILSTHGYAGWLRQWLCAYVPEKGGGESNTVGVFKVSRKELLRLQQFRRLMEWGIEAYMAGRRHETAQEQEAYLKALNAFTLSHLQTLVDEDPKGAGSCAGSSQDFYYLEPEFWRHVVLDYVCGQKYYMRLVSIHRTFLQTERRTDIAQHPIEERGELSAQMLLDVILDTVGNAEMKPALQVEWLISYLKVMSRPHLAQYHHIRQGILLILLRLADHALWGDAHTAGAKGGKIEKLYPYFESGNSMPPLLQYQLLQTCFKRLAGLQSVYLLSRANQMQIWKKWEALRAQYFSAPDKLSFPDAQSLQLVIVKNVKWTSSYGDDESGCDLLETEFGRETMPYDSFSE